MKFNVLSLTPKEWRIFDWHCRLHDFWQTCICIEAGRTRHSKCIKLWLCEAFFKLALLLLLLCAFNSPCAAHNNSHNVMLWTTFDLGALVMNVRVQIFVMIKREKDGSLRHWWSNPGQNKTGQECSVVAVLLVRMSRRAKVLITKSYIPWSTRNKVLLPMDQDPSEERPHQAPRRRRLVSYKPHLRTIPHKDQSLTSLRTMPFLKQRSKLVSYCLIIQLNLKRQLVHSEMLLLWPVPLSKYPSHESLHRQTPPPPVIRRLVRWLLPS